MMTVPPAASRSRTSTVPAETDAPPTEAPVGEDGAQRGRRPLRRPTRPELFRWAGDAISLTILAAVLLWWEMHDGGRNRPQLVVVSVLCLLAAPVLIDETRRLAPAVRWILAAYALGWLVALGFAVDRHDWVHPLLTYGTVPAVGLVTRRIWRRPWGPTVLLALLMVAFGRYTFRSWLQWWGNTMRESQPLWMPLSWRNQSGALMGAFGLLFLGIAWCGRRIVRLGLVLLAGAAFAGVWLSSSRGAIAFTAVAATAMLVAGLRSLPGRSDRVGIVLTSLGSLVAAVVVAFLLLSMLPPGSADPLASRDQAAAGNAVARINHMQAALRMFADRPLVGQGPGSYEVMALDFTDPDANLTSSAHDEYVEVLGEGGLAAGLPFLLLHVAVGVLVWRRLRYGVVLTDDPLVDVRGAMNLGLVGVVVLVAAHSSFDFDWDYPVLPSLLAMGAGALSVRPGEVDPAPDPGPGSPAAPTPAGRWSQWAAVPLVLVLVVAVAGHVFERRWGAPAEDLSAQEYAAYGAPWDAELRSEIAANLLRDGEVELARSVVDDAVAWNPGIDRLRRIRAMVRFEQGELDARALVDTLEEGRSRFTSYLDVADRLMAHGEHELAAEVLDDVQRQMSRYGNWGVNQTVMDVGMRQIAVAGELGGCDAAEEQADELRQLPVVDFYSDAEDVIQLAVDRACA